MADENNPSGQEAIEDNKGGEPQGEPASQAPDGSRSQLSPDEQARRDAQSQRDREAAQNNKGDSDEDRISFLEAREMERVRQETVSSFLTDNSKDYPDVKTDDPLFKYAGSKDEIKEIATELQNRFMDMQQAALQSVQTESVETLTDEQIAEKEVELEKQSRESGRSTFGNYIDNLGRRRKK